ncbi:MAG: TetR/AcrR family transcriptional regulator [Myxococcota bacterium]
MSKGESTRRAILDRAAVLARRDGLEGLTIGALASEMGMSKSGLFAHFGSKEELQVRVLEHAAESFVDAVVRPGLAAPRGAPRIRALFDRWLAWGGSDHGCLFVAAAVELDDRDGPPRERLVQIQHDWLDLLANTARTAVREGHFRDDVDPDRFAHDLYGIMLACHHARRLLRDPRAIERARASFESVLHACQ